VANEWALCGDAQLDCVRGTAVTECGQRPGDGKPFPSPPQCLHESGGLRRTRGQSRGIDEGVESCSHQPVDQKSARFRQFRNRRGIGANPGASNLRSRLATVRVSYVWQANFRSRSQAKVAHRSFSGGGPVTDSRELRLASHHSTRRALARLAHGRPRQASARSRAARSWQAASGIGALSRRSLMAGPVKHRRALAPLAHGRPRQSRHVEWCPERAINSRESKGAVLAITPFSR
jgi:hypothetical protein